jgi:hypothetical protein
MSLSLSGLHERQIADLLIAAHKQTVPGRLSAWRPLERGVVAR